MADCGQFVCMVAGDLRYESRRYIQSTLCLLRALMGISEALYVPASLAMIADYHSSKTRSLAIGIHITGFYIGQALGGLGLPWRSIFHWQYTFSIFGLIECFYSLFWSFY